MLLLHNDVALLLSKLQQVGHLFQSIDTTHWLPCHHQALRRVRLHHWGLHSVGGYRQRGKLHHDWHKVVTKLQAQVYDILLSTTAVFSYAIGSRKLSANKQFFVGAQTAVSLLQTTQIISAICFITDHVVYAHSNKTKIIWIETEIFSFFYPGVDAPHVYVHAWALGSFHSHVSTQTFLGALAVSVDSCMEIKSAPFSGVTNLAEFGERCRKVMLGVWGVTSYRQREKRS